MSAIITENFRRNNTSAFITDLEVNQYYVGLGKSDKWTVDEQVDTTVPTPLGTYLDEREIKSNLICGNTIRRSGRTDRKVYAIHVKLKTCQRKSEPTRKIKA